MGKWVNLRFQPLKCIFHLMHVKYKEEKLKHERRRLFGLFMKCNLCGEAKKPFKCLDFEMCSKIFFSNITSEKKTL